MTLRQYILIMFLATLLCWVAWGFVIFNVDPFRDSTLGFFFFYTSLFFALIGSISLLVFLFFQVLKKSDRPMYRYVQQSFRVGLIVSGIISLLLFLQGRNILTKWNSILLLFIFVTIVCFFLSTRYFAHKET